MRVEGYRLIEGCAGFGRTVPNFIPQKVREPSPAMRAATR